MRARAGRQEFLGTGSGRLGEGYKSGGRKLIDSNNSRRLNLFERVDQKINNSNFFSILVKIALRSKHLRANKFRLKCIRKL